MKEKNGIDPVIRKQKPDQKEQAELRILSPDVRAHTDTACNFAKPATQSDAVNVSTRHSADFSSGSS